MARYLATLSPKVTQKAENIPQESIDLGKEIQRQNTISLLLAAIDKHQEKERSSGKNWSIHKSRRFKYL